MLGKIEGRRRRGTDSEDMNLSKPQETVKGREACRAAANGGHRVRHGQTTVMKERDLKVKVNISKSDMKKNKPLADSG